MALKQISIFLENRKGRLAEVTGVLAAAGVNIRALSLADSSDFGLLRIIPDKPDKCLAALKENRFMAQVTDVIALEVEDKPGGLNLILTICDKNGINIEYMYATVEKSRDNAIVIFKTDDYARTAKILGENGVNIADDRILKNL